MVVGGEGGLRALIFGDSCWNGGILAFVGATVYLRTVEAQNNDEAGAKEVPNCYCGILLKVLSGGCLRRKAICSGANKYTVQYILVT